MQFFSNSSVSLFNGANLLNIPANTHAELSENMEKLGLYIRETACLLGALLFVQKNLTYALKPDFRHSALARALRLGILELNKYVVDEYKLKNEGIEGVFNNLPIEQKKRYINFLTVQ